MCTNLLESVLIENRLFLIENFPMAYNPLLTIGGRPRETRHSYLAYARFTWGHWTRILLQKLSLDFWEGGAHWDNHGDWQNAQNCYRLHNTNAPILGQATQPTAAVWNWIFSSHA